MTGPLERHQGVLRVAGGLALLGIAASVVRSAPAADARSEPARDARTLRRAYGSAYVLTLSNPATILTFLALFTSVGIAEAAGSTAEALLLVAGVGAGSALWWLFLATGVGAVRHALPAGALRFVNGVSAVALGTMAVLAIVSAL